MPSSIRLSAAWPDTLALPGHPAMPLRVQGYRDAAAGRLVLHLHGGAFTGGGLQSGECLAQLLADSGAMVASIGYPLAPTYRFPDAVEAGYATLEWLHAQRTRIAGPKAQLFLAGEEAGGNLAAAIALMARDRAARCDAVAVHGSSMGATSISPASGGAARSRAMSAMAAARLPPASSPARKSCAFGPTMRVRCACSHSSAAYPASTASGKRCVGASG